MSLISYVKHKKLDVTLGIISTLYSLLDPKLSGGLLSPLNLFHSYKAEGIIALQGEGSYQFS